MMLKSYHNHYKLEEVMKEMKLEREGKPVAALMYDFYASPNEYTFNMLNNCKDVVSVFEEALAKMEAERKEHRFFIS